MICRKASRDILRKLAVVADTEADRQGRLVEWKEIFGRHGLRRRGCFGSGSRKRSRYKTGWEETEPTKELSIYGWCGLIAGTDARNTSLHMRPRDHGDDRKTTRETASLRE